MKKHTDYTNGDQPEIWEKFKFGRKILITVPDTFVYCDRCAAHAQRESQCGVMPACNDRTFVPMSVFNAKEMKVKLAIWRLGLSEGNDET